MFTKLGKAGLPILFSPGTTVLKNLPAANGKLVITTASKDYKGRDKNFAVPFYDTYTNRYLNDAMTDSSNAGFAVGSGDTPPTENDYALEEKINTLTGTVTPVNFNNFIYDTENEVFHMYVDLVLTNPTSDPITIKEVGWFGRAFYGNTIGEEISTLSVNALIDRTLLETPITIPATESAVIRYQFDIDVSVT